MERLTISGTREARPDVTIKEVLAKLAEYEDLEEQGKLLKDWIPADKPPTDGEYILLSFANFSLPLTGRYEEDSEGGAYYIGEDDESCTSQDMIVNGWMPLPGRMEEGDEI